MRSDPGKHNLYYFVSVVRMNRCGSRHSCCEPPGITSSSWFWNAAADSSSAHFFVGFAVGGGISHQPPVLPTLCNHQSRKKRFTADHLVNTVLGLPNPKHTLYTLNLERRRWWRAQVKYNQVALAPVHSHECNPHVSRGQSTDEN